MSINVENVLIKFDAYRKKCKEKEFKMAYLETIDKITQNSLVFILISVFRSFIFSWKDFLSFVFYG